MHVLSLKPTWRTLSLLFIAALFLRAATFLLYVQHQERYHQADSMDYHNSALSVGLGYGMTKINTGQPIFWRVPGYPWYLGWFYKYFGIKSAKFEDNTPAQKAALWLQIILCSCIPIILFFLALSLTNILSLAWIVGWISVFHIGLILASTFLLTEGLTLIFFYLFLLFFFRSFACIGQYPVIDISWKKNLIIAGLFLGIATWIRPMGEFVSIVCALLIFLCAQDSWKLKLKKIGLFLLVFFASISPWYFRNFNLTNKVFFCPMFGTYLNCFVAPKVLRELHNVPLEKTWKYLQQVASQKAMQELPKAQAAGKPLVLEHVAGSIAWPIVLQYPWISFKVWMPEVFKTTFDLYSSQLVAFANDSFKWDPLEEFLSEKIKLALYKQAMPFWMRLICWLEFIFSLWLWISLLCGMFLFWIIPACKYFNVSDQTKNLAGLWLKLAFISAAICFMTGGFGYARLRLPIEPLLIISALTLWFYISKNRNQL